MDVVIDDRLPTVNGTLCYMSSPGGSEFWGPLLEKAYAKLLGTYEHLNDPYTEQALWQASASFTGGLTQWFDIFMADEMAVLAMIMRGVQMGSLIVCLNIDVNEKGVRQKNGLIKGYGYCITGVNLMETEWEKAPLIRIRSPWGKVKWKGDFCYRSHRWFGLDKEKRESFRIKEDGEFWMSLKDFMVEFTDVYCCNLSADTMHEVEKMTEVKVMEHQSQQWIQASFEGEWSSRIGTAGGCDDHDTFCTNLQYEIHFRATDSYDSNHKCTIIAALFQKNRDHCVYKGLELFLIGLLVYEMPGPNEKVTPEMVKSQTPIADSKLFKDSREANIRFTVPLGHYVIVPSTYDPDQDGEFLLRIFTNVDFDKTRALSNGMGLICKSDGHLLTVP